MSNQPRKVALAGGEIQGSCHACAFFRSDEEEFEVLLPFAKQGFDRGEKNFQILGAPQRARWLPLLQRGGIDVQDTRGVDVRTWDDVYLRTGGFDQNDMLALIQQVLRTGREQGYPLTRLWANMGWALEETPGVEKLVEYETRLNLILPNYDDVVVCTYDLNRFRADVVMDILRTHPVVIIGSQLQENPFFVPPAQFLRELQQRN